MFFFFAQKAPTAVNTCLDEMKELKEEIQQYAISKNTIILFVCSPKFCISIVFVFSWGHCKSQEKLETMFMQNFGGQTKTIMVFFEVAY